MLFFSQRMKIERFYHKHCSEIGMPESLNAFIAFMSLKGWLNEDKILNDLGLPRKENEDGTDI